jgi:hypothetical protein
MHKFDIVWLARKRSCAYVHFQSTRQADFFRNEMRDKTLGSNSQRVRIDFIEPKHFYAIKDANERSAKQASASSSTKKLPQDELADAAAADDDDDDAADANGQPPRKQQRRVIEESASSADEEESGDEATKTNDVLPTSSTNNNNNSGKAILGANRVCIVFFSFV